MGHRSSLRLSVLHTLRLKGIADAAAIAEHAGLEPVAVEAAVESLLATDLVRVRRGRMAGCALTPEGRAFGARLLVEELDRAGARAAVESAYAEFLEFNDQLLEVCTAWQIREVDGEPHVNDHRDPDHDEDVRARLRQLHARVVPVLDTLAASLDRFAGHRERLQTALEHVLAGEHDWFTKPMFPSYHSIWFELHEDLLATLGTERAPGGDREGST